MMQEDATQQEVSLKTEDKIVLDNLMLIDFVLRKGVLKGDLMN